MWRVIYEQNVSDSNVQVQTILVALEAPLMVANKYKDSTIKQEQTVLKKQWEQRIQGIEQMLKNITRK